MKVSGVTILLHDVRRLRYPFEESIRSLLPLVDELVINIGDSGDGTWEAVEALRDPRIRAFRSSWSARSTDVLSQQTNAALARCTGDWAVYLQADEVLHEEDLERVRSTMRRHLDRKTEGLVFDYRHFWRRADLVVDDWTSFYPRAVRIIRLGIGVMSLGDACGFVRRCDGHTRGLIKAHSGAHVYHYGWCNLPEHQRERIATFHDVFGTPAVELPERVFWDVPVRPFRGSHPSTMRHLLPQLSSDAEAVTCARLPAPLRAALSLARSPAGLKGWARPILPLAITNTWWRATDWWTRRRAITARS